MECGSVCVLKDGSFLTVDALHSYMCGEDAFQLAETKHAFYRALLGRLKMGFPVPGRDTSSYVSIGRPGGANRTEAT
jgi:hypothetical protein